MEDGNQHCALFTWVMIQAVCAIIWRGPSWVWHSETVKERRLVVMCKPAVSAAHEFVWVCFAGVRILVKEGQDKLHQPEIEHHVVFREYLGTPADKPKGHAVAAVLAQLCNAYRDTTSQLSSELLACWSYSSICVVFYFLL